MQNYSEGGFKIIDLDNFIKALKTTLIRRFYKKPNAPFALLFKITITDIKNSQITLKTYYTE